MFIKQFMDDVSVALSSIDASLMIDSLFRDGGE
jgi:hypothetical protein